MVLCSEGNSFWQEHAWGLTKKQFPSSTLLEYNAKREWRGDANNE